MSYFETKKIKEFIIKNTTGVSIKEIRNFVLSCKNYQLATAYQSLLIAQPMIEYNKIDRFIIDAVDTRLYKSVHDNYKWIVNIIHSSTKFA